MDIHRDHNSDELLNNGVTEEETDDDLFEEDEYFKVLLECVAEQVSIDKNSVQIVNKNRMEEMMLALKIIKRETRGQNVLVTCKMHYPTKNIGYIRVSGKHIHISPKSLEHLTLLASVISVDAERDVIDMDLTFHDLTDIIMEGVIE